MHVKNVSYFEVENREKTSNNRKVVAEKLKFEI